MEAKMIRRLSRVTLSVVLSLPVVAQSKIAYIPQALRQCVSAVCDVNAHADLQELNGFVRENRIIADDAAVRAGVEAALRATKNNAAADYLRRYLDGLNHESLYLAVQGTEAVSFSAAAVSGAFDSQVDFDMTRLVNQVGQNLEVCGDVEIASNFRDKKEKEAIVFNANAMTNALSATPTADFGTGVSDPNFTGWIIGESTLLGTAPVGVQFLIPSNLDTHHKVVLKVGFFVQQLGDTQGHVRFHAATKFLKPHHTFNVEDPSYSDTAHSKNIMVSEPTMSGLKHYVASIDLDHKKMNGGKLASIQLSRIAPTSGSEYAGEIVISSMTLEYTNKQ